MKRKFDDVEDGQDVSRPPSLLSRIRNSWEFANLMQYIFIFGKTLKIDEDLDIEELETECIKPGPSEKLSEIGLCLLKGVSSHRGLTPEIFDEYTRRQYLAKAPQRNPFGDDEEPLKFNNFDVFTKLRILHQLSVWTFWNPDNIRKHFTDLKESEQAQWRIEPLGWDRNENTYFLLDDDRLYRQTDPLPPAPSPPQARPVPAKTLKGKPRTKGQRASKRQKLANGDAEHDEDETNGIDEEGDKEHVERKEEPEPDNGLGGAKWECIAITKQDFEELLEKFRKTRDPNEKQLFKSITSDVMPIIDKKAEAQERKAAKRRRELEALEKMAMAKRSSRIAGKQEKQKEIEEAAEAERKKKAELEMVAHELEKQRKMEEARESRMLTREQRLKDREVKRILHEEEVERLRLSHEAAGADDGLASRVAERYTKAELEKKQRELEQMIEEDGEWDFDCEKCGVHGRNLDDGTHSLACEKCGVWQHSKCHGYTEEEAERDEFHFLCHSCKMPKPKQHKEPTVTSLKITMNSSSPPDKVKEATPKKRVKRPKDPNDPTPPKKRGRPPKPKETASNGLLNGQYSHQPPMNPYVSVPSAPVAHSTLSAPPSHSFALPQSIPPFAQHYQQRQLPPLQAMHPGYNSNPSQYSQYRFVNPASPNHHSGNYYQQQRSADGRPPASTPVAHHGQWNKTLGSPPSTHYTPYSHHSTTARPAANSAAPSLSATQGSTDVQFAATHQPTSPNSNSYATVAPHPTMAAFSPTKPSPPSTTTGPPMGNFTTTPHHAPQYTPRESTSTPAVATPATLPPAPTLSPSVNTGQQNLAPPVKKPSPENPTQNVTLPPSSSPALNVNNNQFKQHVNGQETPVQGLSSGATLSPSTSFHEQKMESPTKKPTPQSKDYNFLPSSSPMMHDQAPIKDHGSNTLSSAPTLSPTVNANQHNLEPPVKKVHSEVVMQDAPPPALVQPHMNGLNGQQH